MKQAIYFLLLLVLLSLIVLPVATNGSVWGDEGFYLVATQLVSSGKIPYLDFFYPQMPYLPYFYASWCSLFGFNWNSARIFAGLITISLGILVAWRVQRLFGFFAALIATLLFASSYLVLGWYPTAKTYSLSTLALFFSYLIVSDENWSKSLKLCLLAGIAAGISVGVRLLMAPIVVIFAFYLLRITLGKSAIKRFAFFSSGVALALLPVLFLAAIDPEAFYFNNLGYHHIRSAVSESETNKQWWVVVKLLLGLTAPNREIDVWEFSCLFYLAFFVACIKRSSVDLAVPVAFALIILHLLPTPIYVQYFSCTVPFLLIGSFQAFYMISDEAQSRLSLSSTFKNFAAIIFLFFGVSRYCYEYYGLVINRNFKSLGRDDTSPDQLDRFASVVDARLPPNSLTIAFWDGLLFGSKNALPYPGTENRFGRTVADLLPPEKRRHMKILGKEEIVAALQSHSADAVLFQRPIGKLSTHPDYLQALESGYEKVESFESMSHILVKKH